TQEKTAVRIRRLGKVLRKHTKAQRRKSGVPLASKEATALKLFPLLVEPRSFTQV
ncbi:unnamed protein product, partial [Heterosigma akashiwo]